MSKIVEIPNDRKPFVVIVSGFRYVYPAGESVEVPESVADVIEKYMKAKPKPDPNAGGSGGGASSWNDLKDKPFGESIVDGVVITQDMINNPLDEISMNGQTMRKVSDIVYTDEQLLTGTLTIAHNTGGGVNIYTVPVTEVEHMEIPGGVDTISPVVRIEDIKTTTSGFMLVVTDDIDMTAIGGTGILSKGTWVGYGLEFDLVSAEMSYTIVTPLDEKFMPILTSPSGKKFKLSVDDSGTITATEV